MSALSSDTPLFAAWAEKPLAYVCAVLALTTLVWKTVGLEFLPGWKEIFGGVGAQYPRRTAELGPAWRVTYLLVYGVLGTAATAASVLISRWRGPLESPAGARVARCAKVHGLFHTVIGLHHTLWAVTGGAWGHLTLEQFDVPGLYLAGGIAGFATGLHGVRLLLSSSADPTLRVVRSKVVVDGVSFLTFTSVLLCLPMNALGMPRNLELERVAWTVVFLGPVLWLLADQLHSRRRRHAARTPGSVG